MSLATILVATAAMAVNFGWQKYDDGYEYLVQLEPETLRLLQDEGGVPIDSHVPKEVQPIRRIRIVVGRAELPREMRDASEESRADESPVDEAVERAAFFRPGEAAPPANRYPQPPPATAQRSAIDAMAQPIREVDNLLDGGFEAGIDALEKTGQNLRGAVGNLGSGVQHQLQRTKETLVGPSPGSGYPEVAPPPSDLYGGATTPGFGTAPTWRTETGAVTGSASLPLGGLPPPPFAGSNPSTPEGNSPNLPGTSGDGGPEFPANRDAVTRDDRGNSAPFSHTDNSSRMVPVEPIGSSADSEKEVPQWEPWPTNIAIPTPEPTTPSSTWPAASETTPAQPASTTGNPQPTTPPAPSEETTKATSTTGDSLGWTALAFIFLFGSIGCNFFLGISYLDIRNKYRAALRRTSRSFGRPAASA